MTQIQRLKADRAEDQKMLKALIKLAADVELFTIPLYMSSLYSIAGVQAQSNGTVVPFIGPNLAYPLQGKASQTAYNIIYSVYIQEMLHLQLALNVCSALGVVVELTQPNYPPKPEDPNWLPCLGKLANLNPAKYPEFANVKATLGELDENAINMFLAIELPDEDSLVPAPSMPLTVTPEEVSGLTFGGIGNLYHIIEQYMGIEYSDDNYSTLFEFCYNEAKTKAGHDGITQVNQFSSAKIKAYSHMKLEVSPNANAQQAYGEVTDMINAIISEGEGSSRSNNDFVSPNYTPGENSEDVPADVLWDKYSHWARFEEVKTLYKDVLTWPKWRAQRELQTPGSIWTWEDLLADPFAPGGDQSGLDSKALAEQKAAAWNSPDIGPQLNEVLNSTFNLFLTSINNSWSKKKNAFPFSAMTSISSRVTSVWASGAIPEFVKPTGSSGSKNLHACQGLNVKKEGDSSPGECKCATAYAHTCAGTNSCAHQGGCGYAVDTENPSSPNNFIPGQNTGAGNGGCGAPIPSTQVFHRTDGKGASGQQNGDNVWDYARTLFFEKNKSISKPTTPLTPSPLRIVLPPS